MLYLNRKKMINITRLEVVILEQLNGIEHSIWNAELLCTTDSID